MSYKLKDIIWDFTCKCNKNCSFCGSKDIIGNEDVSYEKVDLIVQEIIQQKDLEFLTITGGEPAIDKSLPTIVNQLNAERPDLRIRILTNGLFLESNECMNLLNYESNGLGVSVNTQKDIKELEDLVKNAKEFKNKITMITNFGNHNLNDFLYLKTFSSNFGLWQVQLTIDDKLQLNQDKIKNLLNYLDIDTDITTQIVRADNFNDLPCSAGKESCSITYKGEVIPCLSFRSWRKTLDVQGVIEKSGDLSNIWNNKFEKYRTSKCACCKDITGIKELFEEKRKNNFFPMNEQFTTPDNNQMIVAVYAVRINDDFIPKC